MFTLNLNVCNFDFEVSTIKVKSGKDARIIIAYTKINGNASINSFEPGRKGAQEMPTFQPV